MDDFAATGIRQRPYPAAAMGSDGQCQQQQGRQESGSMEAPAVQLLLHLCQELRGS